jgi:integrase
MPQLSKKRRRSAPPGMLRHASGQARVVLDGVTVYLGKFGTPEAHARYAEVVQQWQAGQPVRAKPARTVVEAKRSVAEVVLLYDRWMDETRAYSKAGKATTQRGLIRVALRELNRFAGDLAADEFTSATLVAHRDKLAAKPKLSAQGVNRKVGLIKQFVAWAAERSLMPETNAAVIRAVRSLRVTGKKRREPVPLADLTKAIAKLRPHFADMVRLQFLLGCRPGEVCGMRWDDLTIADTAEPWRYLVSDAKTSHHGVETVYWINDEAKEILRRHIRLKKGEFVFRTKRRARFDTKTLTRKIRAAAKAAGVPEFTAHQIRHLAITLIANHPQGGSAAASAVGNHKSRSMTDTYVHNDPKTAKDAPRLLSLRSRVADAAGT